MLGLILYCDPKNEKWRPWIDVPVWGTVACVMVAILKILQLFGCFKTERK